MIHKVRRPGQRKWTADDDFYDLPSYLDSRQFKAFTKKVKAILPHSENGSANQDGISIREIKLRLGDDNIDRWLMDALDYLCLWEDVHKTEFAVIEKFYRSPHVRKPVDEIENTWRTPFLESFRVDATTTKT